MKIDVTVVVPVYNTEKYLHECIESLVHQTLKSVEFIFVDDGSTDRSVEIIEEYVRTDSRIQLIKQKNQFAGVARNNGIKKSSGKYIIFLDSDDFFDLNMLEHAYRCAEVNQAEITMFGYSYYNNGDKTVKKFSLPAFPKTVFSMDDMGEDFFSKFISAPWNKLYLRSFLENNDLHFQNIKKSNDVFFTHMSANVAQRIVFLRERLVFYRINNSESLQGDINKSRDSVVDCNLAIRAKMIEKELYYGVRKRAYIAYTKSTLCAYSSPENAQMDSLRLYFNRVKEVLIPGLFDTESDFKNVPMIMQFYEGSFESFLLYLSVEKSNQFHELKAMMDNEMVSNSCMDYRIGHFLLVIPRKIKQYFGNRAN